MVSWGISRPPCSRQSGDKEEFKHGVAVLATGAAEFKPNEYLYGKDPRVVTHLELDERFHCR